MVLNDEKAMQFCAVLKSLQQDLQPVGALEEILLEKVAYEYFRTANAAQYESAESNLGYVSTDVLGNLVRYQTMINPAAFPGDQSTGETAAAASRGGHSRSSQPTYLT
jgi:hypothetical protein